MSSDILTMWWAMLTKCNLKLTVVLAKKLWYTTLTKHSYQLLVRILGNYFLRRLLYNITQEYHVLPTPSSLPVMKLPSIVFQYWLLLSLYNIRLCSYMFCIYSYLQTLFPWNSKIQGLIESSFFWGYLVTQIPGGFLSSVLPANRWVVV